MCAQIWRSSYFSSRHCSVTEKFFFFLPNCIWEKNIVFQSNPSLYIIRCSTIFTHTFVRHLGDKFHTVRKIWLDNERKVTLEPKVFLYINFCWYWWAWKDANIVRKWFSDDLCFIHDNCTTTIVAVNIDVQMSISFRNFK